MNVTSSGYYTNQYLDKYKIKHPHQHEAVSLTTPRQLKRADQIPTTPTSEHMPRLLPATPVSEPLESRGEIRGDVKKKSSPILRLTRLGKRDEIEYDPADDVEDDLRGGITPAELNIIQRNRERDEAVRRQLSRRRKRLARKQHDQYPDIIHGKSAQEYYSHERKYSRLSDSDISDDDYEKDMYFDPPKVEKKKYDYSDFYVTEKKKYDASPFKKQMYNHKTFREVFQDKNENLDQFNPADFVFNTPGDNDDKNQKLRVAFKTLQTKLGKTNYNDYDYYAQKKRDQEARDKAKAAEANRDIFVSNSSDDSDDEAMMEYLPEETRQNLNKNKNFKKIWRRRLKNMKKELGQDYIKSYHDNKAKYGRRSEDSAEPEEPKIVEVVDAPATPKARKNKLEELDSGDDAMSLDSDSDDLLASPVGPNPAFNPVWNYMLSWLVYDNPEKKESESDNDTSDFLDVDDDAFNKAASVKAASVKAASVKAKLVKSAKKPPKPKKKVPLKLNLNGLKKNYKSVVTNWSQPASALFTGDLAASAKDAERRHEMDAIMANAAAQSIHTEHADALSLALSMPAINTAPQELEVEVDSDFDADQEMYYNPITGQLDSAPPTSRDSMDAMSIRLHRSTRSSRSMRSKAPAAQLAALSTRDAVKSVLLSLNSMVRNFPLVGTLFSMIDTVRTNFPHLDTAVLVGELLLFAWFLYLATLLVNAVCTAVQAICGPIIAIGRLLNRIM